MNEILFSIVSVNSFSYIMDENQRNSRAVGTYGSIRSRVNKGERRQYDTNFKLIVINEPEATNNCASGRKFGVTEACVRRWRMMKSDLRNTCAAGKVFRGPKSRRFPELEQQVVEFVQDKRNEGFPITREIIKMKALELQKRNMKAGSAT